MNPTAGSKTTNGRSSRGTACSILTAPSAELTAKRKQVASGFRRRSGDQIRIDQMPQGARDLMPLKGMRMAQE
jgi:hypothetical protein